MIAIDMYNPLSKNPLCSLYKYLKCVCLLQFGIFLSFVLSAQEKPNIVFLMAEDINNHIGCYGEKIVHTPNIDWLAANGVRYTNSFTVSGVCAPSRAAIITGMYSTAIGTQHMRQAKSLTPYPGVPFYNAVPPAYVKTFTEYLRVNGYFCTNTNKTDYQFGQPFTVWDSHHKQGHWRDNPNSNQPFFSCFTFETTHEINVWPDSTKLRFFKEFGVDTARLTNDVKSRPVIAEQYIVAPQNVTLPPYYPDDITVRQDYARHLTNINRMDTQVGEIIKQLNEDGKLDNTIIFFMGDNGDGIPRNKRWLNDGGLHVPLIVYIPEKWKHRVPGQTIGVNTQLISFIDLAPTVLSIVGIKIPAYMHGKAFLGIQKANEERTEVFAGRDRMDDKYDLQRAVRNKRYKYIRNYWPDTAYNPFLDFMYQAPIMKKIDSLYKQRKLNKIQAAWMQANKPKEELYDIVNDPFELTNLATLPAYKGVVQQMRKQLQQWQEKYGDWLDTPEIIQAEKMWPGGKQPFTAEPMIEIKNGEIILTSKTKGASIGYRYEGDKFWQLYHIPFKKINGKKVECKAVRYGYAESKSVFID